MSATVDHRIFVFGRDGLAREQLVVALTEYGVIPVWVGSPGQCSLEILSVLNPNQIIISLEPLIEDELEPYIEFLNQASISVIYDDAESTKSLSGWDLNRWARHLASKILNMDYMPPAPIKNLIESPENQMGEAKTNVEEFNAENIQDYDSLEIDANELNNAIEKLNQTLANSSNINSNLIDLDYGQSIIVDDIIESDMLLKHDELVVDTDYAFEDEIAAPRIDIISKTSNVEAEEASDYMDAEALLRAVSNLDLQLAQTVSNPNTKLALAPDNINAINFIDGQETAAKPREYDLSKYKLVSEDDELNAIKLESQKYKNISEVPMYLVISGIGGPGVIRSILEKINTNFAGILVLSQAIEANQLPKLMNQLQKITSIHIVIAETDEYLLAGHIYLLPENHAIQSTPLGYQCIKNSSLEDFLMKKIDRNMEIVVLSGADVSLAQSLIQINQHMNNIYIQQPEECFDATLPQLLANIGAPVIRNEILATWFN